jgi:glycosyltransferase involved in cell wall biosynthesis
MTHPSVSVIMPVYNAAPYLRKAIDSILNQTLSNFEFIIINDYSTDGSEDIILSYNDPRIIYVAHVSNKGVVEAMNKGLSIAGASYIAVMHADDIAINNRLENQLKLLEKNTRTAVIAGRSIFINEKDERTGETWKIDMKANTVEEIKNKMIWENCISHPTVMMRASVVKQYQYHSSPGHVGFAVEDYPLWLHILSDGYVIEKLQEPVLLYRIHTQSTTSSFLRKRNPFLVNYITKKFYLKQRREMKRFTSFDKKVELTMYLDYLKAQLKNLKKVLTKQSSTLFTKALN